MLSYYYYLDVSKLFLSYVNYCCSVDFVVSTTVIFVIFFLANNCYIAHLFLYIVYDTNFIWKLRLLAFHATLYNPV